MTSMARKVAPAGVAEQGSLETDTDRVRDAIADRAQRLEARFPRAVDLAARFIVALRRPLVGVASVVAGTHAPEHWREALRGERSMKLEDVCRLAVSERPEALRAFDAGLEILAETRGKALVPRRPRWLEPQEVAAQCAVVSAHAVAAIVRALQNDGKVDAMEAIALRPHAIALREVLAAVDGLAAGGAR